MIFAAMVESDDFSEDGEGARKITVSIIDLATKWQIRDVTYWPNDEMEEIEHELSRAANFCACEYGYFLATI